MINSYTQNKEIENTNDMHIEKRDTITYNDVTYDIVVKSSNVNFFTLNEKLIYTVVQLLNKETGVEVWHDLFEVIISEKHASEAITNVKAFIKVILEDGKKINN